MKKIIILALALLLTFYASEKSLAEDKISIPDSQSAEFQNALNMWLDGEDLNALKALSLLANNGNRAAQVFLARVASTGYLHTHFSAIMSRTERIELFRQPGGLSGKSWLKAAEKEVPLATALQQSGRIGIKGPAIRALFEYGENTIALRSLLGMTLNGQASEAVEILSESKNPPPTAVALLAVALERKNSIYKRNNGSARRPTDWIFDGVDVYNHISFADRLAWSSINPQLMIDNLKLRANAIEHSINVPAWRPLKELCMKYCPSSVSSCTAVGGSALFTAPIFPFSSPTENLLSTERYWSSERIEFDILRRLPDLRSHPKYLETVDACFAPTFGKLQEKAL